MEKTEITDTINKATGLSVKQEIAIRLLISGKSITDTAKELNIDRTTIYVWFEKISFQAYFNRLRLEIISEIENNLYTLYNSSIKVLKESLKSNNEPIRLKAAIWLIEKLENKKVGNPDPKDWIKKICITDNLIDNDWGIRFDEEKYKDMCRKNNLDL